MNDARILIVDDDPSILQSLQRELKNRFSIETAASGIEALKKIQQTGPFAIVVSDLQMSPMSGVELLARVREICPDTVRMMLTGTGREGAMDAVNESNVFRYLEKPCSGNDLAKALIDGLTQRQLQIAERQMISKTLTGAVRIMVDLLAQVRPCAFGRAARILTISRQLADEIVPEQMWKVEIAALLSQLGCAGLSDELLTKAYANEPLSPEEQQAFDTHPIRGRELIANVPRLEEVAEIIGYQAKRFDGTGLPDVGVKGVAIPIEARILKLAIDFDTLRSHRISVSAALAELQGRDGWYDPAVLVALNRLMTFRDGTRNVVQGSEAPSSLIAQLS